MGHAEALRSARPVRAMKALPAMKALRVPRADVLLAVLASIQRSGTDAVPVGGIPIIGPQIKGTHLEVRPISVGRCKHIQHALVQTIVTYKMSGRTRVAMDVDAFINRTTKQYTQLHIQVTKCKDVVSEKSCVAMGPVVLREGICPALHAPLMPWSDLVNKMRPTPHCPVEEGNYSAHHFFIDTSGVDTLLSRETKSQQLEGYVWLARVMIFDHDSVHLCFEATFEFVRVRNTAGWHSDEKRGDSPSSTAQPRFESKGPRGTGTTPAPGDESTRK